MEEIKIQDESGDKKYFTQIPNMIVNHSTAYEQSLYLVMKRLAGERGTCFASLNFLSEKMGVHKTTVSKTIKKLLNRKWVKETEKKKVKGGYVRQFVIVDLWPLNIELYESGAGMTSKGSGAVVDGGGASVDGSGAQSDTKKNHKEELIKNINIIELFNKEIQIPDNQHKPLLLEEKQKFLDYWTEGAPKKERWQKEPVFDIKRRWARWITNVEARMKPKEYKREVDNSSRGGGMAPVGELLSKYKND